MAPEPAPPAAALVKLPSPYVTAIGPGFENAMVCGAGAGGPGGGDGGGEPPPPPPPPQPASNNKAAVGTRTHRPLRPRDKRMRKLQLGPALGPVRGGNLSQAVTAGAPNFMTGLQPPL